MGVGVGSHGESNSCTKLSYFWSYLCGLLNKLEGVGECVWVWF